LRMGNMYADALYQKRLENRVFRSHGLITCGESGELFLSVGQR